MSEAMTAVNESAFDFDEEGQLLPLNTGLRSLPNAMHSTVHTVSKVAEGYLVDAC